MKNTTSPIKRFVVYATLACMVAQPAFAATTDISNVPLSSGTSSVVPNLMFILDDSWSMGREFLPDYVSKDFATTALGQIEAKATMRRSDDTFDCTPGDTCYYTGGQNGFNGAYYDPNVNYRAGLKYDGTTQLPAPLSTTALTPDAYLGGTTKNLTNSTVSTDKVFCIPGGALCKRNGADSTGAVSASGGLDFDTKSDGTSFTMGAGQFPYRVHKSNSSTESFGLPEMMPVGTVSRSGGSSTVTVDTPTPHGLTGAAAERIFVTGHATANMNTTSSAVTVVNANRFTYTSGGTTAVAASTAFYRKHSAGSALRAATTVTVTSTAHSLQTGDIVTTAGHGTAALNVSNVTITKVTNDTFTYGANAGLPSLGGNATWARTGLYNILNSSPTANPIVYRITPVEYCNDPNLINCTLATTPGVAPAGFAFPAYVRFCKTLADATAPGAVSGTSGAAPATPRCISKFIETVTPTGQPTYHFVRYGLFSRENIVSTTASYTNRPSRNDCASAPTCTYTEEIQNYARWYTYYRTRLNTMKTASGRAFQSFTNNPTASPAQPTKLRVGFITINAQRDGNQVAQTNVQGVRYLPIADFAGGAAGTQAANWYSKFYNIGASTAQVNLFTGATPLREALSRVGWIFAGKMGTGLTGGLNPTNDDPVQMSCQRNFALLTTDGYWNGPGGQKLNAAVMDNQDNVNTGAPLPGYTDPASSRASGTYDGNLLSGTTAGASEGGAGTLADVAMYYFKNDLRGGAAPHTGPALNGAGVDVSNNNVPTKPGNKNFVTHQHMVTFSVGMVDGLVRYQQDYESSSLGDFANIKSATAGACLWTTGNCDWPSPRQDQASALDDLWHAAVNGRGQYYSARDAVSLVTGLESALNALNLQVAAAAASSTSSPNITQTDRQIFSTTYETDTWSGRIIAQNIDPTSGIVEPTVLWQADAELLAKVTASTDARTIKTFNPLAADKLKNFAWVSLNATERSYFMNKCSSNPANMTQCTSITGGPTQANVNDGAQMVGYLRGWTGLELNADHSVGSFRDRKFIEPATGTVTQTILGDSINAKPAYVRAPFLEYGDSGYLGVGGFKALNASRSPRLYVGANDGYLHAFHGDTGVEVWAYTPRFLMSGLWVLADAGYKNRHSYFVDGSPEVADVFDTLTSTWKTILVAGVNSGGRGYYALDITDPNSPKGLWEFCSDSTVCPVSSANLGLTYGNPVIGKRSSDNKWVVVVTSGLNNVGASGDGKGYFYVLDAITGALLDTVPTNVGSILTPSGLGKAAGYFDNAVADATFRYVYAGDQLGNVWRLDLGTSLAPTPTVLHLATLTDASGKLQPITAKPALTKILPNHRVLYIGTGRYLGNKDLSDPATQIPVDTTTAWQQSLYAFKDRDIDYGNIRSGVATLVTQTLIAQTATTRTTSQNAVNWNTDDGWVMDFNPGNASPGERVNIDPELILGTLLVTTNVPIAATGGASCSIGGDSWQYQLDFKSGSFLSTSTGQTAGTKTGSVVTVGVAVVQLPSGAIKSIVTGADTSKSTIGVQLGAGSGTVRRFSYRER